MCRPGALQRRAPFRQRGLEAYLVAQGWMDRDDNPAGAYQPLVSVQRDDIAVPPADRAHRAGQAQPVAQLLGHAGAQDLRATN
ncbi:hypothetical protein D3C81_2142370 [compost metagenome]